MWEAIGNDFYNLEPQQKNKTEQISQQNSLSENEKKMVWLFLNQTLEDTQSKVNSLVKWFSWKEQHLINYLNNLDYKDNLDDFMQIAEIKEAAQKQLWALKQEIQSQQNNYENNSWYDWTGRVDHREVAEKLPYSTQIQVKKAYYYHEWIWPDHRRELTKALYSQNLLDWLQNGETGTIKLSTWKYSWTVEVKYVWETILFTFDRFSQSVLLSERNQWKNIPLNLWTWIRSNWKWTNMSLIVNLDWR